MRGPKILARSMSIATRRGKSPRAWQYHSRSDAHSKIACWTLLFDLLIECDAARQAAAKGRLGFGVNHVMVGQINKTLDLVLTVRPPATTTGSRKTFASYADTFGVVLDAEDRATLESLPEIHHDRKADVHEVAVAVEAKACMTEHIKSLPRLHAEILATGFLAKRATRGCIAVSYSLVNAAPTFVTPTGEGKLNRHTQPDDAARVVQMLKTAIPRSSDIRDYGYDAIGVTVVDCRNDGSPVRLVDHSPAPSIDDAEHYERMLRTLCSEFRSRFRL